MIRIQKGESKQVVLTLNEKTTVIDPYYIFELTSNDDKSVTLFTCEDNSWNKQRFNSFTFSHGVTATYSGGFDLNVGTYDYVVYETGLTNSVDITGATAVEIGLLEVVGTVSNYDNYTDIDDDREYTYQP